MKLTVVQSVSKRPKGDLLAVPYYSSKGKAVNAFNINDLKGEYRLSPLAQRDFTGKLGQVLVLYSDEVKEGRLALVGLGAKDEVTAETLRRAYASLIHACGKKKIQKLNIIIPTVKALKTEEEIDAVSEGIHLANYSFDKHKSTVGSDEIVSITETTLIVSGSKKRFSTNRVKHICESVHFCRDLVNGNADDVTPQYLAHCARTLSKKYSKVTTTVFGKARIVKEKMGLLLAVNRGSKRDPAFIIVKYRGDPKSKKTTALVGKGITYDTGGLNLKRTGGMETMRGDMAGAATVLATIRALAAIGAKVNVTGVIAATENGIDADSYKPGDVYIGYAGKSVEIGNTDAEGRLVLADALAYTVKKLKPTSVIDIATLTAAIVIALGSAASGLMTPDDKIAKALEEASKRTGERIWRMPLYEEYRKAMNSDIADIKNTGSGGAGASLAGAFLQEFVDKTPWAHLDIAGTAFINNKSFYHPKYGTGAGVRLLVEFLSNSKV